MIFGRHTAIVCFWPAYDVTKVMSSSLLMNVQGQI